MPTLNNFPTPARLALLFIRNPSSPATCNCSKASLSIPVNSRGGGGGPLLAFASPTLGEHLVRGFVGLAALVVAVLLASRHPWVALAAMPVALLAFRGCPMCWTTGLFETLSLKRLRSEVDRKQAFAFPNALEARHPRDTH